MPTMGDMIFVDYRMDMVSRNVDPLSLATYDRTVGRFEAWMNKEGVTVETARRPHIQAFLRSQSWAPRTQRTAKSYLSAAYEYGLEEEMVARNPCRRVRLEAIPQLVPRTIPSATLRSIKGNIRDERDQLAFSLFAYTGLRTIEVRRLTWPDVSLGEGMLLINGKGQKQRHVPIHPQLRSALVGHLWGQGSAYVVPGKRGGMMCQSGMHHVMTAIYGGRDVRNHDWRRTVGTSLRRNGVQESVMKWIMGWSDPSVFERHYNVVDPQEMQAAIRQLYLDDPI
jgi:integrase